VPVQEPVDHPSAARSPVADSEHGIETEGDYIVQMGLILRRQYPAAVYHGHDQGDTIPTDGQLAARTLEIRAVVDHVEGRDCEVGFGSSSSPTTPIGCDRFTAGGQDR
jgi:hypothetical protein